MKQKIWAILVVALIFGGTFWWLKDLRDTILSKGRGGTGYEHRYTVFPPPQDTEYRMAVNIDPINLTITGHSLINTRNSTSSGLKEVYLTVYPNALRQRETTPAPENAYYKGFDPGWLKVFSVTVNGKAARYADMGITGKIVCPREIKPGESMEIDVAWEAKIPQAAYRFGSKDGALLLGHFYPTLNVKDEKGWHLSYNTRYGDPFFLQSADYIVKVTLPEFYQVVATGQITGDEANGDGKHTVLVEAYQVRDFALAALFNYESLETRVKNTRVICIFPAGKAGAGREVLEKAAAAMQYYNNTFGSYPYPELKLVVAPMKGFQGMEYAGVIFLAQDLVETGTDYTQKAFVIAHEVAHQWWYGLVGNNQVEEPWLDEGLASWSADKYLTNVEYRKSRKSSSQGKGQLSTELPQMGDKQNYMQIAYRDGEAFWDGLEKELGEQEVINVLRSFLARYRYKTATTEDLKQVIIDETNRDMTSYFDEWFAARDK